MTDLFELGARLLRRERQRRHWQPLHLRLVAHHLFEGLGACQNRHFAVGERFLHREKARADCACPDGKHVKRWRTIQKVVAKLGRQLAQLLGDGIEALLLLALW